MAQAFQIRPAKMRDQSAITQLFRQSYPQLLPMDYNPRLLRDVLPLITTAQPSLLACGTYFVAEAEGHVIGAGDWTDVSPVRGAAGTDQGHIRHVATHPEWLRKGVARTLIERTLASARAHGMSRMQCMSTRTARSFYRAMGFCERGEVDLTLAPGVFFPAMQMDCVL